MGKHIREYINKKKENHLKNNIIVTLMRAYIKC